MFQFLFNVFGIDDKLQHQCAISNRFTDTSTYFTGIKNASLVYIYLKNDEQVLEFFSPCNFERITWAIQSNDIYVWLIEISPWKFGLPPLI